MCFRYVAIFGWTLACWISFQPLILTQQASDVSSGSASIIHLIAKLLFALFLCASVLLGEKFAIQLIASKFHERSYAGMSYVGLRFALLTLIRAHCGPELCRTSVGDSVQTLARYTRPWRYFERWSGRQAVIHGSQAFPEEGFQRCQVCCYDYDHCPRDGGV